MGVGKALDRKSDLQGYSVALVFLPFDGLHAIFYYSSIAAMSLVSFV